MTRHLNLIGAQRAYYYAAYILKGKYPEGESKIAKDAFYSYRYAFHVLRGRFPEGEAAIATDTYYAYCYALEVIKRRWLEAESRILSSQYAENYCKRFGIKSDKLKWQKVGF